jgi:hypothetical protein
LFEQNFRIDKWSVCQAERQLGSGRIEVVADPLGEIFVTLVLAILDGLGDSAISGSDPVRAKTISVRP